MIVSLGSLVLTSSADVNSKRRHCSLGLIRDNYTWLDSSSVQSGSSVVRHAASTDDGFRDKDYREYSSHHHSAFEVASTLIEIECCAQDAL